jgi:hypothetical protein
MGRIKLSNIKSEIAKSGSSKGKFLYFKENTKVRVRFLTDLEDGMEMPFHDSFALGVNVPCQELFGRECQYCEDENLRTRNMYAWSVYDYDSKEVKILMFAVNQCSPVPSLASMYESYGTLCDRDYEIKQVGSGQGKTFSVIPLDKSKFRNTKVKPLSDASILKYVDKAYPADNSEDFEDEDEEETKQSKTKGRTKPAPKKKTKPEPEEDDWEEDEEEQENDYDSMKPQELYKLCKERDIDCNPKKSKEYYIDLLEEADGENSNDDWSEDEEDEWEEDEE